MAATAQKKRAFCVVAHPAGGRVVARSSLNVVLMVRRGTRPARGEIDEAALRLLARHGAQILATARRHAVTPEDAEDAYQRGIEILLTKAPSTSEDELIPWLKTVVKHEAWALRRQRERHSPVTDDGELRDRPAPPRSPTSRPSGSSACASAPRRSGSSSRTRCARCG